MEKKKKRSLEEILNSLKEAEKEFDEKLDKYGMKEVKSKKKDEANPDDVFENEDITSEIPTEPVANDDNGKVENASDQQQANQ